MKPYVFVHVPKTAGTSFRESLVDYFGKHSVLYDYGKESPMTSTEVLANVYDTERISALTSFDPTLICGHFYAKKYLKLCGVDNVLTFVRNPVGRVISEYKHFKRHKKYNGTLLDFANLERNINVNYKFFIHSPWQAFGFIGVSEHYLDSLEILNQNFGFDIQRKRLNIAPKKTVDDISLEQKKAVRQLNDKDEKIYQQVVQQINWRFLSQEKNFAFVNGVWNVNNKTKQIEGFAFIRNSNVDVELEFIINNNKISIVADKLDPKLVSLGLPKNGRVAFQLDASIKHTESISCTVAETGQPILQGV